MSDFDKQKRETLKLIVAAAAGGIASRVFTGCATPPIGLSAAHIVVLGEDSSNLNAIASLKPAFEKQTGIRVDFDKSSFEVSYQKANQDLMSGTGLYDIIMQYNFSLASFVTNNWIVSFDELQRIVPDFNARRSFEADLFANAWHEVGFYKKLTDTEEQPIGYPFAANTMLLVYSRPYFDDPQLRASFKAKHHRELQVPKTWPEFRELAEFFMNAGRDIAGVVLEGATGGWLYYEWASVAFNMGGGVMKKLRGWQSDPSVRIDLATPENIEATNLYTSLKRYNSGDFYSTSGVEQREIMKNGKVAMALMWSDYLWPLVQSRGGDRFGFAPIPGTHSGLAGGSFFINRMSRYKKEAAEFILYVMQKEQQVALMKKGLCSSLRSAYSDPSVISEVPYAQALYDSLDRGVYFFEAGPDAELIQNVITKWVQSIWRGDVNSATGLRNATAELQSQRTRLFKRM